MAQLTEETKVIRVAQTHEVMTHMYAGMTQKDACELVGMSPDTFRRWLIACKDDVVEGLSQLISILQKEQIATIASSRMAILNNLMERAIEGPIDTKDLLAIYKITGDELKELAASQGTTSRNEARAAEYLTGPKLIEAKSRMGGEETTVNVRPLPDGSIDITTKALERIEEGQFRDVDQPEDQYSEQQ
jgi:hypothetical protein